MTLAAGYCMKHWSKIHGRSLNAGHETNGSVKMFGIEMHVNGNETVGVVRSG